MDAAPAVATDAFVSSAGSPLSPIALAYGNATVTCEVDDGLGDGGAHSAGHSDDDRLKDYAGALCDKGQVQAACAKVAGGTALQNASVSSTVLVLLAERVAFNLDGQVIDKETNFSSSAGDSLVSYPEI